MKKVILIGLLVGNLFASDSTKQEEVLNKNSKEPLADSHKQLII